MCPRTGGHFSTQEIYTAESVHITISRYTVHTVCSNTSFDSLLAEVQCTVLLCMLPGNCMLAQDTNKMSPLQTGYQSDRLVSYESEVHEARLP